MYICRKINIMKKLIHYSQKVVFLLFAILFIEGGNSANAQYPFDFSLFGDSGGTTPSISVVRSYDNFHFVVYHEGDNGQGTVSLIDMNNILIKGLQNLSQTMNVGSYCQTSPHVSIWQVSVNPSSSPLTFFCIDK